MKEHDKWDVLRLKIRRDGPTMDTRTHKMITVLGAIAIGTATGAAIGSVLGSRTRAIIGALAGAGSSALYAYLLAGGFLLHRGKLFFVLTTLAAVGCGLMAGFFFSFSVVVMKALAQQPQASGMAAMQTINVAVFNPWFGAAFVGTPVACALAIIFSLFHWHDPSAVYLLIGGALYLIGTLLVTLWLNIPKNDALAAVAPTAPSAADVWSNYLTSWTAWNHVRTAAAFAATASLTVALWAADF